MKKCAVIPAVSLLLLLEPVLCPAPIYMRYDGVDGSATADDHKEWILIETMSSPIFRSSGSSSTPTFGPIALTKKLDKSSPQLMLICAQGSMASGATIDFTETLDNGQERRYLQYTFSDVLVSSYSFDGKTEPSSSDPKPAEQLSLNYEEIKISYGGIRKSVFLYDENGDLEEIISEGSIARPGGTVPPLDLPPPTLTDTMTITGPGDSPDASATEE